MSSTTPSNSPYRLKPDESKYITVSTFPLVTSSSQSPPTVFPPVTSSDAATSAPVMVASVSTNRVPSSPAPTLHPYSNKSPSSFNIEPIDDNSC